MLCFCKNILCNNLKVVTHSEDIHINVSEWGCVPPCRHVNSEFFLCLLIGHCVFRLTFLWNKLENARIRRSSNALRTHPLFGTTQMIKRPQIIKQTCKQNCLFYTTKTRIIPIKSDLAKGANTCLSLHGLRARPRHCG